METDNPIQTKSYAFALRIVKLYRYFCDEKKEYVLSKQIVHSGTSIGANVEEAIGGQSNKDFLSKMSIAYKEARETHYWPCIRRAEALRRFLESHKASLTEAFVKEDVDWGFHGRD